MGAGFSRLHVFRATPAPVPAPIPAGVRIAWVEPGELLPRCEDSALDLPADWAREALARGDRCLAAFLQGELAGYSWVARGRAPHVDGIEVEVPASAEYRYKTFVRAEHRGRGIATALYRAADAGLAKRGGGEAFLCIAPRNHASQRSAVAAGARRVGTVAYWVAGPIFAAVRSPGARRSGLTLTRPRPR
jgi:GNAT superfamily N-acetyltransferase